MTDWLPFLVAGLSTGSVYALASMGLVVTYTTSGVFNFAHGAVAMICTYAFYTLRLEIGLPTGVAVALSVGVVAPLLGAALSRLFTGRLAGTDTSTAVVASLGLLVALQGLAVAVYGANTRQVAPLFPRTTFDLPGVKVGYDQVAVVAVVALVAAGLALFFRRSHLGLQTQAVVEDADLAELMGADSRRVTALAWMLGCAFAALSGILIVPALGLDAVLLTLLVVYSFGAVALGRLTSLARTYAGGLSIGVVAALSTKWVATTPALSGLPTSVPFLVLFVVLVAGGRRAFAEVATVEPAIRRSPRARRRGGLAGPGLLLLAASAVPAVVSGSRLLTATATLAFVLVFASLGLLVGLARQTSLCHAVFVVFGATTLGHLQSAGLPWGVALLLTGAAMVPVGAFLAVPSLRLSGLFLALATFGFGVLAQFLIFPTGLAFGRDAIAEVPRPAGFGGDVPYYWLVLGVVAAGVAAIEAVRRTRLGRLLAATADSPKAVTSLGVAPTAARVLVFCLTAFLAGLSGGLLGSLTELVTPASFDFFSSLLWITLLVATGPVTLGGAVAAALLLQALPAFTASSAVTEWQPVAFGVAAVLLARSPNGLVGLWPRVDVAACAARSAWRNEHRGRARDRRDLLSAARP